MFVENYHLMMMMMFAKIQVYEKLVKNLFSTKL